MTFVAVTDSNLFILAGISALTESTNTLALVWPHDSLRAMEQ